jgi:hypothetical protein
MPFASLEIDFEHGLATIDLSDGRCETFPMPAAMVAAGAPFLHSKFDFTSRTLSFTVTRGDVLIVEVGVAGTSVLPQIARWSISISSTGSASPSSDTRPRS